MVEPASCWEWTIYWGNNAPVSGRYNLLGLELIEFSRLKLWMTKRFLSNYGSLWMLKMSKLVTCSAKAWNRIQSFANSIGFDNFSHFSALSILRIAINFVGFRDTSGDINSRYLHLNNRIIMYQWHRNIRNIVPSSSINIEKLWFVGLADNMRRVEIILSCYIYWIPEKLIANWNNDL